MTETQTNDTPDTPSDSRYHFTSIDIDSESVHADVVRLVGDAPSVLELGPATGYMSRAFSDRGSRVVGIEIDREMAQRATEFCERMIVGDLDTLDFEKELGAERFDAIVAADVLEHLKDPLKTLTSLRPFLKPDGFFVISVPNIAHGSVRLALLSGRFEYQDTGLLDATHLRFFTRETLEQLLDEAGLGIAALHRHDLNLDASEVAYDGPAITPEIVSELETDPDARTYQFVVKATPMQGDGLRERRYELEQLRDAIRRVAELERTIAQISGREGELRRALIEAHDQLLRRDHEIENYEQEAQRREAELNGLRTEVVGLRIRVDRIKRSPVGRLYELLRNLPGLRAVLDRRQAGIDAEFRKRTKQDV
jgi:2-polyprenyl-3-methyl-5-hydroxy-6-metoxy-1,4-benzoquinol methylase